jgi:uncharacterized damage-inducible protein DinB
MEKETLLARLDRAGREMDDALRDLGPETLTASGACGTWSLKDVLAHLAVNDDWTAEQLEDLARGVERPPAEKMERWTAEGLVDPATRNDVLYRASRFRPPEEVVREVARARRRLVAAVAGLPEARLDQRLWFTGSRTVGETVAHLVEHAREHRRAALAALATP